jgi:Zn-dependent protease with chaperone function
VLVVVGLLGYAILAALTSPLLLARGAWRITYPRLALALWNVAFLSGLAALIASLCWSITLVMATPSSRSVPSDWFDPTVIVVFAWVGLAVAGGVGALVLSRLEPMDAAKRRANEHLTLLEATAVYRTAQVSGVLVNFVDCTVPLAVSFAGSDRRIVVTSGLEDGLTPAQLRSVIEHERTHLTHRHGLIGSLAQLNLACLPKLFGAREFERSAHLLVELIADDQAARVCGVPDAANALVRVGKLRGSEAMELRAQRLVDNSTRLPARSRRRIHSLASTTRLLARN